VRIGRAGQRAPVDVEVIGVMLQRQGEHHVLAVPEHPVTVDPAFFGVFDVVVDDKQVARRNQLKIADIGQEVRLHDGHLQGPLLAHGRPAGVGRFRAGRRDRGVAHGFTNDDCSGANCSASV
jgi:hypothetical protein